MKTIHLSIFLAGMLQQMPLDSSFKTEAARAAEIGAKVVWYILKNNGFQTSIQ
jgi:hypothetical protein